MSHSVIHHAFTLFSQNTEANCAMTALSMQLSNLGIQITPKEISIRAAPFRKPDEQGFTSQELATFCLSLGLKVTFYSFDGRYLDFNNHNLESIFENAIQERPSDELKIRYLRGYLNFVQAGGVFKVEPFVSQQTILQLLAEGPVNAGVVYNVLAGAGKEASAFGTHSVLIYGYEDEKFLIADPDPRQGKIIVSSDQLISAIAAAQIENDNSIFMIE